MKLKIAIDARLISTKNTGDTSYWRGLIYGLSREFPNADLVLFTDREPTQPMSELVGFEVPFDLKIVKSLNQRIWSYHDFPRAALAIGANVIHSQYNVSPLVGKAAITTIHDVSFFVNPQWYSTKDRLILTKLIPQTCKRVSKILTVSHTSKSEIERFIPEAKGKIQVTYNAIPPNFRCVEKSTAKKFLSDHYGITRPIVFSITSPWARKNSQLAQDAFHISKLSKTHQFVTCGPGTKQADHANHLGYVNEQTLCNLYAAADCFILPSFHEGFGIPILESYASGTPVLCGPGGAIPEIANGAAIICADYDPQTWANELDRALSDSGKLSLMIESGKKRVKDFSWIRTAQQTMSAYEEVCRGL